ncbi:hypothetical protein MBRA1_002529 [Malassezia brasiliensis]|uniref:EF-hand domain-containing protein n=1 Tax=Malassezia brasiliensis TaxID=1821822 RepID=A0AAF0DYH5_9BASI|nr:hypothetical protein MBRA1_002529 [Malassezia brasiliensis]
MSGLENLSPAQIKQLQRVFYAVDRDEDNYITSDDVNKTLRSLGAKDATTEAPSYLSTDVVGTQLSDRGLDATSFLTMMGNHIGVLSDPRKLLDAFESFDERDEGFVDVETVHEILAGDQEAIDKLLVPAYLDRTRKRFEYRKFVAMLGMCPCEELA